MTLFKFTVRAIIYLVMFLVSWYAMSAVNYEKVLKKNHVIPAQILYFLIVASLAYLTGSFLISFMYNI